MMILYLNRTLSSILSKALIQSGVDFIVDNTKIVMNLVWLIIYMQKLHFVNGCELRSNGLSVLDKLMKYETD